MRQTYRFISDAEWPIIKAKYKDGSLDIFVSSPKKTDDRLWIPTHNQPHMLKVGYALLTNQEKPTDNDEQNMEMNEDENCEEVDSEDESEWSTEDESEWSTEDEFSESETKDEKELEMEKVENARKAKKPNREE